MKRRGVIRRVMLPALWLVIGTCIAASLVKLAFLGGTSPTKGDDPLKPTGKVPAETVAVSVGDVRNTLTVEGTIELDPARSALAPTEGVLSHTYVSEGSWVRLGAPLFQVRTDAAPTEEQADGQPVDAQLPDADQASRQAKRGAAERRPARPAPRSTYTTVVSPVEGRVSGFAVEVGDPVSKGTAIATVQPHTFKASGSITPLDRYRLLDRPAKARVTIKGGPRPFACRHLTIGDEAALAPAPGGEEGGGPDGDAGGRDAATTVSCRVPARVTVFDGLTMSMEIPAGAAQHVLVVPVTGVRGLLGTGTVWVVDGQGRQTRRGVQLGITDGKMVEVRSGLRAGDVVLRYVPGSSPSKDGEMDGAVIMR